MSILLPQEILNTIHSSIAKSSQTFIRDGIILEKGVVLTSRRIDKNIDLYKKLYETWAVYPDLYIKLITPVSSKFKLKFFQILFLRACLRHGRILTVAPRAAGKSFICLLALYLICIFRPGSHVFMCSPGKSQGAKISAAKIKQLQELLPLLKQEIIGEGNYGSDYVEN